MTYDAGRARAIYELGIDAFERSIQRAKQLYAELQAAQQQATRPQSLPGVPSPSGGASPRAASFAQEQRAVAGLEAQQARLARTQGDAARAAELEASAQQRLTAAMVRTDITTTEAIALQRQLATVQTQAARASQQAPPARLTSSGTETLDQLKSGLLGIVGPAAAGAAALGALQAVISRSEEGFRLRASLDASSAAINSQLQGARDLGRTWQEATAFAERYRLTQADTNEILANSSDVLRASRSSVTDLETALLRLQSRDVSKPITEAARAMRELQAGDVTSIKELFNVPAQDALRMKNEIQGGADAVQVLLAFLDRSNSGMKALEQRTEGAMGKMLQLRQESEKLTLALGDQATGPGLAILDARLIATQSLTADLRGEWGLLADANQAFASTLIQTGDFEAALAERTRILAGATQQGATSTVQAANANELFVPTIQQVTAAMAEDAVMLQQVGVQSNAAAVAAQQHANALAVQVQQSQQAALQSRELASLQATLVSLSGEVAAGHLTAGNAAVILARQYGIASGEASRLLDLQAQVARQARQQTTKENRDELRGARDNANATQPASQAFLESVKRHNEEAAAEAKRRHDAEFGLRQAQAKTNAERIANLRQELAGTTDINERLRIQTEIASLQNSGAKAHTSELSKQLNLEEKIRDSKESQLKASIDARKLAAQDVLDRLKEDQQLAQARRVLASSHDERFRQAAQARIDLIGAERDSRTLALQQAQATAGGSIIGGRVFQSVPGAGGGAQPIPALPVPGGGAAAPAPGAVSGALGVPLVQVFLDSEPIAARVVVRLAAGQEQNASAGGVR